MPNEGIIMLRGKAVWFKNRVTRATETFVRMLKQSLDSPKKYFVVNNNPSQYTECRSSNTLLFKFRFKLQRPTLYYSIILAKSRKKII